MPGSRFVACLAIFLLAIIGRPPTALGLDGKIIQVGYPSSASDDFVSDDTAGADKYRPGCWTPVLVEFFNEESAPLFEGRLRIVQPDRDGDLAVVEEPIMVRGLRRVWLYAMPQAVRGDLSLAVQVIDANGAAVKLHDRASGAPIDALAPRQKPVALRTEDLVVLDISTRPLSQIYRLAVRTAGQKTDAGYALTRPLIIARQSAANLPPHWCGLDMVDVIVWDAADPDALTDKDRQLTAIVEWTRRGGTLVLGVGRTGQNVQKSSLSKILPGEPLGTSAANNLPELSAYLNKIASPAKPISVCPLDRGTLRPGARTFYQQDGAKDRVLLCRRTVGRGQIVYVGAELRDLYAMDGDRDELTMRLLGLRRQPEDQAPVTEGIGRELFPLLSQLVGFQTQTWLYFLFAIAFVVSYILLSTLGAWQWLKGRGWQKHNWAVFGVMVVAASLLSLGVVRVIRGVGRDVQQLSVVDVHAGSYDATSRCFFGVKTATHERLDLLLPGDCTRIEPGGDGACVLRTLPPEPVFEQPTFVVPYEYLAWPAQSRLEDVPFRATLKQFEGFWRGELPGRVTASLSCFRDEGGTVQWLDPHAWIQNDLGVDLRGCVLIQAMADPIPTIAQRWGPAGLRAYKIGDPVGTGVFRKGQRLTRLDLMAYGGEGRRDARPLSEFQTQWASNLGIRAERYGRSDDRDTVRVTSDISEAAMLLASTFTEFKPEAGGFMGGNQISRTYLKGLDVSELLRRDVMLLVGFSDTPGPATICCRPSGTSRDFAPLHPSSSLTMYRVLIPIVSKN